MADKPGNKEIEGLMETLVEPRNDESYAADFAKLMEHIKEDPSQFTLIRKLTEGEDKIQFAPEHLDELKWRFENREQLRLVCPNCPPRSGCIRLPWYEWGRCVYMCWPPQF